MPYFVYLHCTCLIMIMRMRTENGKLEQSGSRLKTLRQSDTKKWEGMYYETQIDKGLKMSIMRMRRRHAGRMTGTSWYNSSICFSPSHVMYCAPTLHHHSIIILIYPALSSDICSRSWSIKALGVLWLWMMILNDFCWRYFHLTNY